MPTDTLVKPGLTDTQELLVQAERIVNDDNQSSGFPALARGDLERVVQRGYTLGEALNRNRWNNEGSNRVVYKAVHAPANSNLQRDVVVKVPEPNSLVSSVNARMNRSRRNIDLQEAIISGKLSHPYIVRTVDSFQLADGRTVNAEDYIEGRTVRKYIRDNGPLTERKDVKKYFTPILDAFEYLHDNGVLHRDVSAENMMVPLRRDGVIITDLQNAAMKIDIESEAVPTKGSTSCTHPMLLNACATGVPSKYTDREEVYSLGAVLYEMVTGRKLFDYSLDEDKEGKPVLVNGQEFRVKLKKGGKDLESISLEEHETELKEKLGRAPRYLRSFLYDLLSTKSKKPITNIYDAKIRFGKATRTTREEIVDAVKKYASLGGSLLCLGFAAAWGISSGAYTAEQNGDRVPTLSDVLRHQTRTGLMAESTKGAFAVDHEVVYGKDIFNKYYKQGLENKGILEGEDMKMVDNFLSRSPGMDKRLVLSMIRSMMLSKDEIKFDDERLDSLIPKDFVKEYKRSVSGSSDLEVKDWRKWMYAANYIQGNYRFGDSLEEVYARVLCTPSELRTAVAKTQERYSFNQLQKNGCLSGRNISPSEIIDSIKAQDHSYYPREIRAKGNGLINKNTDITRYSLGYGEFIQSDKREIIDRAVAFWLATDDSGVTHFDKYQNIPVTPQRSIPASGEAHK